MMIPCPYSKREPISIVDLIPELQLKIFDYLDPVASTCLGLTCKKFNTIHSHQHGSVGLHERCHKNGKELWVYLVKWIGQKKKGIWRGWVWGGEFGLNFIQVERLEILNRELVRLDGEWKSKGRYSITVDGSSFQCTMIRETGTCFYRDLAGRRIILRWRDDEIATLDCKA
jgi:hypothetical protein